MSISILNRGASGGLKPELIVTAPAGSIIDLLQNGIIIDTYTLGASETEHTFVVKVGTYTVRGTLGTKVQNKEVAIEVAGQYEVEIDYKLWLYREGDECEDVTGGWYVQKSSGDATPVLTKESKRLRVQFPQHSDGSLSTHKKVFTGEYSKRVIEYSVSGTSNAPYMNFSITGCTIISQGNIVTASPAVGTVDPNTEHDSWAYIANTVANYIYIHNVWLE